MEKRRLLELALEGLKSEVRELEIELAAISKGVSAAATRLVRGRPRKRRKKSAAERKAHSEAMRAYWARKKAKK